MLLQGLFRAWWRAHEGISQAQVGFCTARRRTHVPGRHAVFNCHFFHWAIQILLWEWSRQSTPQNDGVSFVMIHTAVRNLSYPPLVVLQGVPRFEYGDSFYTSENATANLIFVRVP